MPAPHLDEGRESLVEYPSWMIFVRILNHIFTKKKMEETNDAAILAGCSGFWGAVGGLYA